MFRLRSLYYRGLLVARRNTISTLYSLASSRRPTHICVCVYVCVSRTSAHYIAVSYRCSQKFDLYLLSVDRNCVNGWYLETSSLGLLLALPDFIDTVLT